MKGHRLPAALAALALALPGAVAAAEDDARDAEIFGASDDARDAEIFGASDDARDAEIFGASDDARDAEIFGSDDDAFLPASAPSDRPVPPPEGDGLLSSSEIDRRLGNAADKLAIGGLIYLRAHYDSYEDQAAGASPLSSPNLFDLYLDARPNDDLRFFARARINHSFARPAASASPLGALGGGGEPRQTDGGLDQLWMKFDVEDVLFVTAGRQPIKWGAGRFWNPTDFLNRSRRDPLAVFDERLGVGLLKLHLPVEASGWNVYAIADFEGANTLDSVGGAFRIEKLLGDMEISLSTAVHDDQPLRLGADVSFPLWEFDVRAEAAVVHGDETVYFRGVPEVLLDTTPYQREDDWIPQVVVGADIGILYSDDDSITLGAEYFFNDAGYDDPRYYPALLASGGFTPLYLGRHYGAVYASAVGPGSWDDTTLIASVLGNLSDRSFLGRFDYRVRLLTYLDVNTFAAWHFGRYGEFRLGREFPGLGREAVDELDVPDGMKDLLAEGGSIPAPIISLGAGLSLRF